MYHIKDKDFIRGKVPMTKEEIRAVSIAKMEISDEDVCIDIGGGTGSVSIEMARFAKNGHVYTIEQKEEAIDLIKQNMEKFGIKNMTISTSSYSHICIAVIIELQQYLLA